MNTVYLSLGSNIGDRCAYLQQAVALLSEHVFDIKQSHIYETKPCGYDHQNSFLNMSIEAKTTLSPRELLNFTQHVEHSIGRQKFIHNGPRTIDIDIVFYDDLIVNEPDLIIPHPRAYERDFVMIPMLDLNPNFSFQRPKETYIMKRYIPTQIVGILNLSPESFGSESYVDMPSIIERVRVMIEEGADTIDIGAQSTKPGAEQLSEEVELERLRDVIPSIKKQFPNVKLSLDTTRFSCAQLAVEQGIDMINDISGGRFSPETPSLIVNTDVKIVIVHSQGDFISMHRTYAYTDIIEELKKYFQERITEMLRIGVRRDQIILDPGIGFSKTGAENFEILKNIKRLKELGYPLYIGLSRKKFIGTVLNKPNPQDRDVGSTVLHTLCMDKDVAYVRVHNVVYAREARDLLGCL